jgi:glycosyltransferase involved in cell wall biosynthesis
LKPGVLHIIDSFEQGGTERQALQLVRLLQSTDRYRIHLACLQHRGLLRTEADQLSLGEILEYPLNSFYDLNFIAQLLRLVRFLKNHDIKLVHTHDFYTNIFGMTAATIANVPARIASKRETEGFRSPMQKRVERGAYKLARAVLVNAGAIREQLAKEGVNATKISVLYNGLDLDRVKPTAHFQREQILGSFGVPAWSEPHVVTIVANLQHTVKDHPTFLRAAARVLASIPQVVFLIAGEGNLLRSLRKLGSELGINESIFFLGRCERVADLLAISDVCVLSSRAEGFSNSILEYMGAGRAVVATDVGGTREAVTDGETGYIVSAGDDRSMAERIISLLRDPQRAREMGERGRAIVKERFSCQAQLAKTLALYDRLLTQNIHSTVPGIESIQSKRV